MRIGLIQSDTRWQEPEANRAHLETLIDRAGPADLYALPETCTTGFLGDAGGRPEGMDGPSVAWIRGLARELGAAVTGSLVIGENGRRYNRMIFATADGSMHTYDKAHLFGYGGEDERYTPGRKRVVFEFNGWRINLQICYDLRFPVWCRNRNDFDLQIHVANWPAPRVDAWKALLKARAIENQAFVVAVNRAGRDGNGIEYPGASGIWDAQGHEQALLGAEEAVAVVEIDREALEETRQQFPFLADADPFSLTDR